MQSKPAAPEPHRARASAPHAPGYLDRFMDFVARQRAPYWLTYLALFMLQTLTVQILMWVVGRQPPFELSPLPAIFPLWLWGPMAIMTHINAVSREALSGFRPLLDLDDAEMERLAYEFRYMPARGVIISGVLWAVVYAVLTYVAFRPIYLDYGFGPVVTGTGIFQGLVSFAVGGAIYYHSVRQLRLVDRTVKTVAAFNLFRLDPVYAFSRVTSRIGVSWMLLASLTFLFLPIELAGAPVVALAVIQVALALAAFVLPLWFVNRRLVAEKRGLLAELNGRAESILARLHDSLDGDELDAVGRLHAALNALNAERDMLTAIPTWPWRAGTLTGFLSAIGLPILLLLAQKVVGKWLGG